MMRIAPAAANRITCKWEECLTSFLRQTREGPKKAPYPSGPNA
jgi:hypothetical protein